MPMNIEALEESKRQEAFRFVEAVPGSLLELADFELGFDREQHFMAANIGEASGHLGFVALHARQFDALPSTITVDPRRPVTYDNKNGHATLPELEMFNCQEAYFSLLNPKRKRLGLYMTDGAIKAERPSVSELSIWVTRFIRNAYRVPSTETEARYNAQRERLGLPKETGDNRKYPDLSDFWPTFGIRRAVLGTGRLTCLGAVRPIPKNSGWPR